jgi:hypothetical protein
VKPTGTAAMAPGRKSRHPDSSPGRSVPAQHLTWVQNGENGPCFEVLNKNSSYVARVTPEDARDRIGAEIHHWCRLRPGVMLTPDIYYRWNLSKWMPQETALENEARYDLHEVKYDAESNSYLGNMKSSTKDFFEIIFCSIGAEAGDVAQAAYLQTVDIWCQAHPGESYLLFPLGSRTSASGLLDPALTTDVKIIYHTDNFGCAAGALANTIMRADQSEAARIFGIGKERRFRHFRDLAQWMSVHTRWTLQKVKSLEKSPRARLEHLFQQTNGLFLVIPTDGTGHEKHVIGIDMNQHRILDSAEEFAMRLSHDSLSRCAGGYSTCTGLADIRKLYRTPASLKKRKRHS